jgi:hypothetical protein
MEGQPAEPPLKVCPHCSVASRTDAESCPSCGKPYARPGLQLRWLSQWRWWYAIPIVAAAFALGYFGLSQLFDGDEGSEGYISIEQASAVPDDITPSELEGRLGGEAPVDVRPRAGRKGVTCSYYGITGERRSVWEFCFEGERMTSSAPLGAETTPVAPVPPEEVPEGVPGGEPPAPPP